MAENSELTRAAEQDARQRRAELVTVPGVREAIAAGFTPLEELTGAVELAGVWPVTHLRVLADTRAEPWAHLDPDEDEPEDSQDSEPGFGDGNVYLVRSPWPSVDLETVLTLAHRWRQRNERTPEVPTPAAHTNANVRMPDSNARKEVDRTFFLQAESWILAFSRGRVNRLR